SSDAGQGFGITTKNGATAGDAFDLFTHFEHGGDMTAALREIGDEMRQEAGPLDFDPFDLNTAAPQEIAAESQDAAPRGVAAPTAETPPSALPAWPAPDLRLMADDLDPPPPLPLAEVLTPRAAEWVASAAEGA